MSRPEKSVTLCPLGPLTNVALALAKEPRIAERLDKIVLMGGAQIEGGNVTPAAEFNIYVDPHAAARVFGCGAEIVVMSLDVTHQALIKKAWLARLKALGTRCGEAFTASCPSTSATTRRSTVPTAARSTIPPPSPIS